MRKEYEKNVKYRAQTIARVRELQEPSVALRRS